MKKPFAVIGFTYISVLLLLFFSTKAVAYGLIVTSAVFLAVSFFPRLPFHKNIYTLIFTVAFLAGLQYTFLYLPKYERVITLDGRNAQICGRVIDKTGERNGKSYYTVKVRGLSDTSVKSNFKIRLTTENSETLSPGDVINSDVSFSLPPEKYGLTSRKLNLSNGIYLYASAKDGITKVDHEFSLYYYAVELRNSVKSAFDKNLSEENAGLLKALVIGDKSGLTNEIYKDFQNAGVIHILVVSGMHISIIMAALLFLFGKLKIKPQLASLLTIPVILGFVAITGFTPSSLRAGIMASVFLLSRAVMRQSDALNSLGLSVFLMVLVNPFSAVNLSFLLSVLATLGIIVLGRKLKDVMTVKSENKYLKKFSGAVAGIAAQSISANIFILPVSIMFLGTFSVVFIITNLLIVPVATVLMIIGIIFIPVSLIGIPFLVQIIGFIINIICRYILGVASFFGGFEKSVISITDDSYKIFLASAFIIFGIYLLIFKAEKHKRLIAVILTGLFAVTYISSAIVKEKSVSLTVLDVENGIATVLTDGSMSAVIGVGGDGLADIAVKNKLQDYGFSKTDLLIIPKNDFCFADKAVSFTESVEVDNLILSQCGDRIDYSKLAGKSERMDCTEIHMPNGVEINKTDSLVFPAVVLNIKGTKVVILSNGMLPDEEKSVLKNADLVILNKSCNGISDINCKVAVLSAGKDSTDIEINKLTDMGISVIDTSSNGDLKIKFFDNKFVISR